MDAAALAVRYAPTALPWLTAPQCLAWRLIHKTLLLSVKPLQRLHLGLFVSVSFNILYGTIIVKYFLSFRQKKAWHDLKNDDLIVADDLSIVSVKLL